MAVMAVIRFPVPTEQSDRAAASLPDVMGKIGELGAKHGATYMMRLVHDDEFCDLDQFPSYEAYEAFKSEAIGYIQQFEAAVPMVSVDEVWEVQPHPANRSA